MYKVLFSLVLLILFNGCLGVSPQVLNPSEKVFEEEDILILMGLRAEQVKNYESASNVFSELYKNSSKKEYLYRSLQNDLHLKKYDKVIKRVDNELDESFDDSYLVRLKILALINLSKLEEAKNLALTLVDKTQNINDYILVSDIYVKLSKYDTALKYLEGA
jgi:tetratricopeptide (TPR) repeat protein